MMLLYAGCRGPIQLYEAAAIDGASAGSGSGRSPSR